MKFLCVRYLQLEEDTEICWGHRGDGIPVFYGRIINRVTEHKGSMYGLRCTVPKASSRSYQYASD